MTPAEAALAIAVAVLTLALAFAGLLLWALWGTLGLVFDDLDAVRAKRNEARAERDQARAELRRVQDAPLAPPPWFANTEALSAVNDYPIQGGASGIVPGARP